MDANILYKNKIDNFFTTEIEERYKIQFVYEIRSKEIRIHPIINNTALTSALCFKLNNGCFELEDPRSVIQSYMIENNIKMHDIVAIVNKLTKNPYNYLLEYFLIKSKYYRLTNHENLYTQLEI